MKTPAEALFTMESMIDSMMLGTSANETLDVRSFPQELQSLAEKLNRLNGSLDEMYHFGRKIAMGHIDCEPPPRTNYLSSSLKEIHSQLISFCWSIEQLIEGKMVSKLHYPGALFDSYNALIDKVSCTFGSLENEVPQWGGTISSWRYHQILSAINQLHIMIIEVNGQGEILFANPPAKEVFGDMTQLPYHKQGSKRDGALLKYLCTFGERTEDLRPENVLTSPFPVLEELFDEERGSWYKITSDKVNLTDGSIGLLHMVDDISEWKRQEYQLTLSATIDPLTSAYTRKAGMQKLEELISQRADRHHCVAFVDVDELKTINDQYGHNEGDFTIKTISEILLSCVRKTDWVVRYGGDEFLLLFLDCGEEQVLEVIARMRQRLESVNEHLRKPYKLSFSVGLSTITANMEQVSDLISVVDQNMYKDKTERKGLTADML